MTVSTHDDDRRTADPGDQPGPHVSQLRELRAETEALARALPGTMRRLTLKAGDCKVEVEWQPPPDAGGGLAGAAAGAGAMSAGPAGTTSPGGGAVTPADEEPTGHPITAPLVGTFYTAPEPGADPFVSPGGPIEAGQDVCIVEAMKIMNRLQSDVTGTVREILVSDGEIVEYGQTLMIIDVGPQGRDVTD